MDIWLNVGWVILGLVCLYFGAEWLVKGSVAIALILGIPALIVALTIVAFGTSAPELLVSLDANLHGKGDLSLGNIVGSNICNLALVLGAGAVVRPIVVHSQLIRREMPILLIASLAFVGMLLDGQLSRIDGIILTVGVIAYTFFSIYIAKRNPEEAIAATTDIPELDEPVDTESEKPPASLPKRLLISIALLLVGFALLILGANRLVAGGEFLAKAFGVPEAIIALTLFAFGTSLPELATSVVASLKNQGDIVTGNVIGSCVFNLLAVAGITACVLPIVAVSISRYDFLVMLGLTFGTYILIRKDFLVSRLEGGLLLVAYFAYIGSLALR